MSEEIKERIDLELDTIVFSEQRKNEVLNRCKGKKMGVRQWLNQEVEIDFVPAIAILCLCIWGYGIGFTQLVPDEQEIQDSQIQMEMVFGGEYHG